MLRQLAPRLQAVRRVERELDRHLARRFSVFRYVRTDELGLSRIIADLLDPSAEHGQGQAMLEAMLKLLPETRHLADSLLTSADNPVRVATERPTPSGRRIDVSVEIPTRTGRFCLAFENKPYAGDQPGQIECYLRFLEGQGYENGFLFVYVPPRDQDPSASSLRPDQRERWGEKFRVMPYVGGDVSLENWFRSCREGSDAGRLYWFLRQAQEFCRQQFGASTVTNDAESLEIRHFLFENPELLQAAHAVHDAWPIVLDEVGGRFLRHVRERVEGRLHAVLPEFAGRLQVRHAYGGKKRNSNYLFIGLLDRPQYEVGIQSDARQGPNGWIWGVRAPQAYPNMTAPEKKYCDRLRAALKNGGLSLAIVKDPPWEWPQYEYLPRYRDWALLVPNLHREVEDVGGDCPVTTYYVDGLLDLARDVVPVLDRTELADRADSDR